MIDRMKSGMERVKLGAKAGVTLVELLVVMLIVVILAVSLTPLFRDYITRAQYTAEAVPVVAEMRTKTTLFQYDRGYLPGVPRTAAGAPLTNAIYTAGASLLSESNIHGENAALVANAGAASLTITPLQTFAMTVAGDGETVRYHPGVVAGYKESGDSGVGSVATVEDIREWLAGSTRQAPFHFSRYLDVDYEHYTGNRLRPNHVFFRVDHAGYRSGAHMYVIGVFGDGNGLAAGTGYAVMEIHNPTFETKIVATWERWRAVGSDVGQIGIIDQTQRRHLTELSDDLKRENVCYIGNVDTLMSSNDGNESTFVEMLGDLRDAGWVF